MTVLEYLKNILIEDNDNNEKKLLSKKVIRVFYKISLNLIKKGNENNTANNQQQDMNNPNAQQAPNPNLNPMDNSAQPGMSLNQGTPDQQPQMTNQAAIDQMLSGNNGMQSTPSVYTEDEVISSDENTVIRKMEGEVQLSDEQASEIQGVEDIIELLGETRKNGIPIFDEFTAGVIEKSLFPQTVTELQNMLDIKSEIRIEISYGYKINDSVGVKILKRRNSPVVIFNLIKDGQIIGAPANIDIINSRILQFNNYERNRKNVK